MVTRTVTRGGNHGGAGDDVLTGIAQQGRGQIHMYAREGNDTLVLDFSNINAFSHGHHVGGDTKIANPADDTTIDRGNDTFIFQNLGKVNSVVVGRIEDFDPSRDQIKIRENDIDHSISLDELELGHGNTGGFDWRVVKYDADREDSATGTQQWLLIDTGQGYAFYALEGARVTDGDGAFGAQQEAHFIGAGGGHTVTAAELAQLAKVGYVDPQNYVPAGYTAQGGDTINDDDNDFLDASTERTGTDNGDLIAAGLNDDSVRAGTGNDVVWGGSGNDTVFGQGGNDTLFGGIGDDSLVGGTGNDQIHGDVGNDRLSGNGGSDTIWGGDGNDNLKGGGDNDILFGGDGEDYLAGGVGNDQLHGGQGNDVLKGLGDNDTLFGQTGNDKLLGDSGHDILYGGDGNDNLKGGGGDDQINGDAGNDFLKGGTGVDTFVFSGNFGNDRIIDFAPDVVGEKLDLADVSSITSFSDLMSNHVSQVGLATVIDDGSGNTIRLENVSLTSLTADDFIF